MRDRFESRGDAEVELVKSGGGVFEIDVDGKNVFSKKAMGRFPGEAELQAIVGGGG